MSKPRVTERAPTSAGFFDSPQPRRLPPGVPFDPTQFAVNGELPDRLAEISDVQILDNLQAFDPRITAAACYERRIKQLKTASGQE